MEKRRSIIGLNLSVFLFMFGVGMIVPLLPQKIMTFTGSLKTVGYLASAFAVPFVLLQFPIGHLSDRYGFRRFLISGYFICSASGLLYCFSNTPEMVFLGRLLQGIGEAPLWALAPALLSTLYPKAKGKVIGFYNAFLHLGLTLGSAFGIIIAKHWTRTNLYVFAFLGVIGVFLILTAVEEPRKNISTVDDTLDTKGLKPLLESPGTLVVLCGIILYGAGYGISLTVLPGFLIQNKGFTQAEIGWFFMLFYIGISLSQIITGPISDRHGRKKTMIWGLMMISIGFWSVFWKERVDGLSMAFLASVGLGVFCVSSLAWLNHSVGNSLRGTVSGTFYLFWGVGFFVGPLALGAFGETTKGFTGFHILALLYFFQALLQGTVQYRGEKVYHGSR